MDYSWFGKFFPLLFYGRLAGSSATLNNLVALIENGISLKVSSSGVDPTYVTLPAGFATSPYDFVDFVDDSYLKVAKDIAAGPIARVRIPFRVPSGFHCNFYACDNPFYRQAITN